MSIARLVVLFRGLEVLSWVTRTVLNALRDIFSGNVLVGIDLAILCVPEVICM